MAAASAPASGNKLKARARFRSGEQPRFSLAIANKIMEKGFCHKDGICLGKIKTVWGPSRYPGPGFRNLDLGSGFRIALSKVTEKICCNMSEPQFPSLWNGKGLQDSTLEMDYHFPSVRETVCNQTVWVPAAQMAPIHRAGGGGEYQALALCFHAPRPYISAPS